VIQIKDREPTLGHGAKVVAVSLDKVRLIAQLEGAYYWLFFFISYVSWAPLPNITTDSSHCYWKCWKCSRKSGLGFCIRFCARLWVNYCVLLYIHNWDLMKSVVVMAAHLCYLFVMKAMVYSHTVMTALIVMLPSIFLLWGFLCNFIGPFSSVKPYHCMSFVCCPWPTCW